ncbi:MAG: hypothetical protein HYZ49_09290 [Chloroflexi bacterium]|nr:hypothetical protein [Chloroflexota bacterium]
MRRSLSVTWLSLLVFILGLMQWTRAAVLFARQPLLIQLDVSLPLPYAILSAAMWGGALVAASVGLKRLNRWGWWLTLIAVTGSQAQAWLDRILFSRSDYAQLSTGFALGLTVLVLALVWGVLGRNRF